LDLVPRRRVRRLRRGGGVLRVGRGRARRRAGRAPAAVPAQVPHEPRRAAHARRVSAAPGLVDVTRRRAIILAAVWTGPSLFFLTLVSIVYFAFRIEVPARA